MMQIQNTHVSRPNRAPGDRPRVLVPTAYARAVAAIDCVGLACAQPCWPCRDRDHDNECDVIDSGDRLTAQEVAA